MIKFARLGPSSLHSGRYHFEQQVAAEAQPLPVKRNAPTLA
jgi:hypothetical protein